MAEAGRFRHKCRALWSLEMRTSGGRAMQLPKQQAGHCLQREASSLVLPSQSHCGSSKAPVSVRHHKLNLYGTEVEAIPF